jgi:hypothetical protein
MVKNYNYKYGLFRVDLIKISDYNLSILTIAEEEKSDYIKSSVNRTINAKS